MNAFELAIVQVARQYEQKLQRASFSPSGQVSAAERRQMERVLRWAKPILEKMNQRRTPDERSGTSLGN
jgi:hypothetical protein